MEKLILKLEKEKSKMEQDMREVQDQSRVNQRRQEGSETRREF